jgi:hypothetical protein
MASRIITQIYYDRDSEQWHFRFGEDCRLTVACPWRIVSDDRVAITGRDHLQQFGLQQHVDAIRAAMELLGDRKVVRAQVADETGDFHAKFEDGVALQTFTDSSGYESGSIQLPTGELIILMGGGEAAIFAPSGSGGPTTEGGRGGPTRS